MNSSPQVAFVVVSYNTRELLIDCLSSVGESTNLENIETVVVDNASTDGSYEAVRRAFPRVTAIANRVNNGFGAACNQAIKATTAPLILLLNSDAQLTPQAFKAVYDSMRDNVQCGAAGCRLVDSSGLATVNTRNFLTPFNQALELLGLAGWMNSKRFQRTYQPSPDDGLLDCTVDWISGACLMLRRAALDEVGLFDEQFFMYSEDEDLCYRLKKSGWLVCFSTAGVATHHGSASSNQNRMEMLRQFYSSQILFLSKHRGKASALLYLVSMKIVFLLKRLSHLLSENRASGNESAERRIALSRAWSSRSSR